MSYQRFEPSDFRPPHAIWFQQQDDLRAFGSLVNNAYRYEIFNKHGRKLVDGSEKTLSLAMQKVFDYFKTKEKL